MSRVGEKLEHFAVDVMADVGEERRKIMADLDDYIQKQYDEKENECLGMAYEIIQESLVKIDQKKSESISRIIMGNRTRLFEKRTEIFERVYAKTIEKLLDFKDTEDYKAYLEKHIKDAKGLLGQGEIWVLLDYSDRDLATYIKEATGCQVEIESKKVAMIGGCIIHNRSNNTIVDCAFSRKLEDSKELFVQQCGLEID